MHVQLLYRQCVGQLTDRPHRGIQPFGTGHGVVAGGYGQDGVQTGQVGHQLGETEARFAAAQVPVLAAAQRSDVTGQLRRGGQLGPLDQDLDHPDPGGERFGQFSTDPVVRVVDPGVGLWGRWR